MKPCAKSYQHGMQKMKRQVSNLKQCINMYLYLHEARASMLEISEENVVQRDNGESSGRSSGKWASIIRVHLRV